MPGAVQRQAIAAVDLGSESCRVSLLRFRDGSPHLEVVHRCANGPVESKRGLVWDFESIFQNVMKGLKKCAELAPEGVASVGVDGWAVDYVRLDDNGRATDSPFCYRDERTVDAMAALLARIPADAVYQLTGAQTLRINTLYQLYADHVRGISPETPWINLPEYLMYLLGAGRVSEYTNATHTQMVNVRSQDWCREIFSVTGLSLAAAPQIVQSGTDIGKVAGPLTEWEAFRNTRIIAPACHDTASAIAGIPAEGDDWTFISSGTWSLIGTIVPHCVISDAARSGNFTNQGGVGGSTYFLKNVNGMWILRQCVEQWRAEGVEWQLTELLEACDGLDKPGCLINVDDAALMLPGNMPARINAQLCASGVAPLPENASAAPMYAGLIFHSLAARYAQVLKDIAAITGKRLSRVFVVGGGSRNRYLNRLIEETTQLQVIPGSAESSTIGNFAIQLAAAEKIPGASVVSAEAVRRWAGILNQISASVCQWQPAMKEVKGDWIAK